MEPGCFLFEIGMHRHACSSGSFMDYRRNSVLEVQGKNIANTVLSGFTGVKAWNDAIPDDATYPLDRLLFGSKQDCACTRSQNEDVFTWPYSVDSGTGNVRVNISNRNRRTLREAHPLRCLWGKASGTRPQLRQVGTHARLDDIGEAWVKGSEEVLGREVAILIQCFVACRTEVARLMPGELPYRPVGGLNESLGGAIDFRSFFEDLQCFTEKPF